MRKFIFNGVSSDTYGVIIGGGGTFNAPERDITSIAVPGRNGELTIDNGRFKNIEVTYPCHLIEDFKDNMAAVREWLCSARGYKRLEDDYDPDHYRMGRFIGGIEASTYSLNMFGDFDLKFDCMPQRFVKGGEDVQTFTATTFYIDNPTPFDAMPIVTLRSSTATYPIFTITNGNYSVTQGVKNFSGYCTFDCELQNAYKGTENKNADLHNVGDFPVLKPGLNRVNVSTTIESVEITPRWFTV